MSKLPFRPESFDGSVEDHLPGIQAALVRALTKAQKSLTHETLKLARADLKTLASLLVGFGEDLHCEIGIWRCLEQYHREFFGTPLPFIVEPGTNPPREAISTERVRHLLWVLYPQMIPDLIIAPDHVDLILVADVVAKTLREQFADLPRESGVRQFLETPDDQGWEVKRKLIWVGTQSYLFRRFFEHYRAEQDATLSEIAVTDDFLCQECTRWAGLGALEVLAGLLDLRPERRADLLSWSERHNAVYKVLSGDQDEIEVLNLINDCKYRVRMNLERNPFKRGVYVHGSLVPWDGEWYWSGTQKTFPRLAAAEIERLKASYRSLPTIFYRYSPDVLAKARALVHEYHEAFVARHGKDWVVYPDGLAMAADIQREARERIDLLPPEKKTQVKANYGSRSVMPEISIPLELLTSDNGVGVYFNPDEGQEIVEDFNDILSGLKKRGRELTPAEGDALRQWVRSEEVSPGFVRRLADEFGEESIKAAFLLGKHDEGYALEYLLRRYKGRYFRPRYPTLTLME